MTATASSTPNPTEAGGPPGMEASGHTDPGFKATLASELIKFRTATTPRRNLLLGVLLSVGLSTLIAFVFGAAWDELQPVDRASFDPIVFPLAGSLFLVIFFVAVGVNVVAGEYNSGMMRLTLTATPKRGRVLYAKVIIVSVATAIAGLVAYLAMFGISQVIFGAFDLPTASFGDADVQRLLLVSALVGPLFPVIAVALTFLFRSTAAALSTTLALIFAPSIFGGLLPGWWQRNILSLLPGAASDSLAIGHLQDSEMYYQPAVAALVVVAWLVGFLALAQRSLTRRDA